MLKKIAFGLAFVSVLVIMYGTVFPRLFKKQAEPVDANLYGSIIRLTHDGRTFCSGTVIEHNLIVTAAHCVSISTPFGELINNNPIDIRPNSNEDLKVTAKALYVNPRMDYALLIGNFSGFKTRPYTTNPGKLEAFQVEGHSFTSCGYPLNGPLYCTSETFKRRDDFAWKVEGVLLPGMSGGPTMENGVVVAVNSAVSEGSSIVAPLYNIMENLK